MTDEEKCLNLYKLSAYWMEFLSTPSLLQGHVVKKINKEIELMESNFKAMS